MKKILLILGLIIVLNFTGCENKQQKIETLKTTAIEYQEEGRFNDAIDIYNQLLDVEENKEYRDAIHNIEEELKVVEVVKEFRTGLEDIRENKIRSGIEVTPSDLKFIISDLRDITKEFENVNTSNDWKICTYVNKIKDSMDYQLLKVQVDSTMFDNAEENEGISELLALTGDDSLKLMDTMLVSDTRDSLSEYIDAILKEDIPQIYN